MSRSPVRIRWVAHDMQNIQKPFDRLVEIMSRLRGPSGCPWDLEQTHESLICYLIEESYEVIDAIHAQDPEQLKEELGDLILQVVFHAQLAKDEKKFNIDQVIDTICEKLVRRHPHIFGSVQAKTAKDVVKNWDAIKANEEKQGKETSILSSIPKSAPALFQSFELSQKAAKEGFDWPDTTGVMEKIQEEINEFKEALQKKSKEHIEAEAGDLLFSISNLLRHLGIQPELALSISNQKFRKRFLILENKVQKTGKKMKELKLNELEKFWQEAKQELGS